MPKKNTVAVVQKRNLLPLLAITAIVVGLISLGIAASMKKTDNAATGGPDTTSLTTESPVASTSPVAIAKDEGVTWKDEPVALSNLELFKSTDPAIQVTEEDVDYYTVGTDNGQDIVLALIAPQGPSFGDYFAYHFLKKSDNSYELVTGSSDKIDSEYLATTDKVTGKNTKTYRSIAYQPSLTAKNIKLTASGDSSFWFANSKPSPTDTVKTTLTKFADTEAGPLYIYSSSYKAVENTVSSNIEYFILKRPNGTAVYYQLKPDFMDQQHDGVPAVTWNDGTANKDTYRADGAASCGSVAGLSIIDTSNSKDLKAAGKTKSGETVYEFSNKDNAVLQAIYKTYIEMGKSSQPPVAPTIEEYLAAHALFVYKDKLDRLILFEGGKYGPLAECGKPVIYLYPTKTTKVSVKVGAEITVSEPDYGNGWDVTAEPSGKLTNKDGKTYESLFWEGNGQEYPSITHGFVVAKKDVVTTLRSHLTKLGLNAKESADFLEFWLPKMPNTPYTRLTWFGTHQMDKLAPLTVSPKPDTSIRIFLDFAGLQQPISLQEQKLSSIPRKGFTLVEWGGLLVK